jgi:uncharacterized protein YndB with AHSA1/START domain
LASSIRLLGLASLMGLSTLFAGMAGAEVVSAANNGFEVHETVHVAAPADKAFAALLTPSRWWSSSHTFSRNASNLSLDARAGGCWCENMPEGGSAEHMRVVLLMPGKILRLRGPLGPLQGMGVDGALTFTLKSAANGTDIVVNYAVGGYTKDGFDELSKAVDHVLGEQMELLKKLVDG